MFNISITLGLTKKGKDESSTEFKKSMCSDVTFIPTAVDSGQLKKIVTTHNYSLIHWDKNYRTINNFLFSTGIALDIDDGPSLQEAEVIIKGLGCYALLVTTQSHQKEKKNKDGLLKTCDKYRILIPTNRRFHSFVDLKSAMEPINKLLHNTVDMQAFLASQFFIPSPDNALMVEIDGPLYDPDKSVRQGVSPSSTTPGNTHVYDSWDIKKIELHDENGIVLSTLPVVKTAVFCPFCDDINSQTDSGWLSAIKKGELRRVISCSHCRKSYFSLVPVLTDDEFIASITYRASEIGDTQEPAQWIVKDVLAQSECFSMFGDPGSGKSYAMLQLGLSVADAMPEWLGYEIDRHGPVLYILNDGSHRSLKNRIRKLCGYMKIDRPSNFYVLENQGVYKLWAKDVEKFISIVNPILVIIDSLSLAQDKGDENQASDQREFANLLKGWCLEYNLNVSVIHHTNKSSQDKPMHLNNFRGSNFWAGILSSMIEFRKIENSGNIYRIVKSRDGSPSATDIRESKYEEYAPQNNGNYNLNPDALVSGYKYIGPHVPPKRVIVTPAPHHIFEEGQSRSYKDLIFKLGERYGRSKSWAEKQIRDWVQMGDLKKIREANGGTTYTYHANMLSSEKETK